MILHYCRQVIQGKEELETYNNKWMGANIDKLKISVQILQTKTGLRSLKFNYLHHTETFGLLLTSGQI